MNARTKLNRYALQGILIAAAGIGLISGSWVVFLLAALVLGGMALHDGSFRPTPRKRGRWG